MNILAVLGHPNPNSLNAALARAAVDGLRGYGHKVWFHDLCAEGFDPLLPAGEISRNADLDATVAAHCRELAEADGILVVHPNWWGMPPAVLTGWVDRVFRPGVAYEFLESDGGEGVPRGLLKARAALVLNTADTYPEREARVFGDPLERIWRDCVFGLCGHMAFHRRVFSVVCVSTPEEREAWLTEAAEMAVRVFGQ